MMPSFYPGQPSVRRVPSSDVPKEPCPLCNGLGGWDRSGIPIPPDAAVPERTTCQGCGGSGEFSGWLREVM